jgi:hypothetical protein
MDHFLISLICVDSRLSNLRNGNYCRQGGIDPDLLGHGGASGIRAAFIGATAILMVAISFPGNF